MFSKKQVKEIRYVTRDEKGRLELWQSPPEFVNLPNGESFFSDFTDTENQLWTGSPVNRMIINRFLILPNACQEIIIRISKKSFSILPGRVFLYKKNKNLTCINS